MDEVQRIDLSAGQTILAIARVRRGKPITESMWCALPDSLRGLLAKKKRTVLLDRDVHQSCLTC